MLDRTRARYVHKARLAVFRATGVQKALDEVELRTLESHMGFPGQWEEHRRFQLDFAQRMGLTPQTRFIEVGCGPLTLGIPLIEFLDANCYVGIDVRPEVLNLAWQQVGKHGLAGKNARLVISQSFGDRELPAGLKADMMWSFSVLYHLTDALLDQLLHQVSRRLMPTGVYIANVNASQPESTWLQFPFNRRDVSFYGEVAERHGLKCEELGTMVSNGFRLDATEKTNVLLRFTKDTKERLP